MSLDPLHPTPEFLAFWDERHLGTLTTHRPDGTPHVVPVGVTYDPRQRVARVITRKTSKKVRNVLAGGPQGIRAAVCQLAGARWLTVEGTAVLRTEAEVVKDAEKRYALRYGRTPSPNPDRVVVEISVDRVMGRP
ncbi:TIGR03618 family F420-dependent PPOX class oxidoreductase [Streptomyces sp. NPDC006879]|uniref:TIGR03618 family F420-dependent PPOX class oxidoreductase n=1 Tax=Streptomyces sp. NPDC006879 TaxID=3364767 RepID=UPI003697EA4E